MPKVSVVIRAKNEERFLGETLTAIKGQTYRNFDVVLVDSGSTDRTVEIADGHGATVVSIAPEDFTYGRALNLGVDSCSGELLVSLSAHATPESERWLESLVSGFHYSRVAGVYGRHIPRANATLFELLGMRISGVTSTEWRIQNSSARFSNANGAFRRELWELAPFDESLPGAEDIEWARRMQKMGYHIVFEPRAAVYHSHGEPLHRLIRRQLHDQPVILAAWLTGMSNGESKKIKARVRGRESIAK